VLVVRWRSCKKTSQVVKVNRPLESGEILLKRFSIVLYFSVAAIANYYKFIP
jgi:hypothetical protein